MYLVAAEAYLKAGDNNKALARLNEVHQRAGLAALTGTITIDNILDESACENFGNCARGWISAEPRHWLSVAPSITTKWEIRQPSI